jgi:hypothetical protein
MYMKIYNIMLKKCIVARGLKIVWSSGAKAPEKMHLAPDGQCQTSELPGAVHRARQVAT